MCDASHRSVPSLVAGISLARSSRLRKARQPFGTCSAPIRYERALRWPYDLNRSSIISISSSGSTTGLPMALAMQ